MTHRELPDPVVGGAAACAVEIDLYMVFEEGLEILVASQLSYARADPYAVRLLCHVDSAVPAAWYLSRDILTVGMWAPAGIGDVSIRPGTGVNCGFVFVTLGGGEERVVLRGSAWKFHDFLDRAQRVVPLGEEHRHIDLDELIRRLREHAPPDC